MLSHSALISRICTIRLSYDAPPSHKLHAGGTFCRRQKKSRLGLSRSPAALPFDLSPPPIDLDPLETVTFTEEDGSLDTHASADEALDAFDNGAVVVDLSDYGRIRVSGEDRIQFLHNQTTADFECLSEGQGCDTVFVTPVARTIDISHAWVMKNAIMLVVSPMTCGRITEMMKKYIFFSDKVDVQDISKETSMCVLLGPKSSKIMDELNLGDLVGKPYGSHKHYSVDGMPLTVAVGSTISVEGFTFMMAPAAAGSVKKALIGQGAVSMNPGAWETLRILQGRPAPGKELTEEFNVLEAGLWRAVSLNKDLHQVMWDTNTVIQHGPSRIGWYDIGYYMWSRNPYRPTCEGRLEVPRLCPSLIGCYKGQETISRLLTYDGIKQRLWGIRLSSPVVPGSIIAVDGRKVGKLTSYTDGTKTSGPFGLGYIKRRKASEGGSVTVGDTVVGKLVEVPFLKDQLPPSKA